MFCLFMIKQKKKVKLTLLKLCESAFNCKQTYTLWCENWHKTDIIQSPIASEQKQAKMVLKNSNKASSKK